MARSRFPCLEMGVCLPLVCWIGPYFVGPAGLPVKSTAEPFQLPAQLSVGHAATVKLPLPVRCGVTSGGRGTPRSWRDWIRAWPWPLPEAHPVSARGYPPKPCSPAGPGPPPGTSSLRSPQVREECSPTGRCPSLLSGSGVVDGEVSSIVLWWSFSVKRPAVRMVVVRSQAEVNPPVTQQIGGVDLIGSGAGGTGQLHYRGCPGVRDGVDTPSPYPTATCPPVGWSNG